MHIIHHTYCGYMGKIFLYPQKTFELSGISASVCISFLCGTLLRIQYHMITNLPSKRKYFKTKVSYVPIQKKQLAFGLNQEIFLS
jgi:hypothetical protein